MAFDPNNPPKPIIETCDDDRGRPEWTPFKGLINGSIACAVAGAAIGTGWYALASSRPDITVSYLHEDVKVTLFLGVICAMCGFACAWIMFAVMHRFSQMVSPLATVAVAVFVILLAMAKQIAVAKSGFQLPETTIAGWQWLAPALFFKSNIGTWAGLAVAIWMFREGDSITEIFG